MGRPSALLGDRALRADRATERTGQRLMLPGRIDVETTEVAVRGKHSIELAAAYARDDRAAAGGPTVHCDRLPGSGTTGRGASEPLFHVQYR